MEYEGNAKLIRIGNNSFYEIPNGKNKGRLAEAVGGHSLIDIEGEMFLKWTLREEIEDSPLDL
jgi:hypothetical protein